MNNNNGNFSQQNNKSNNNTNKANSTKTASPVIAETARRPDGTRQKGQTQPATESVARAVAGKARPDYARQLS